MTDAPAMRVVDGPDKHALQWALTYPESGRVRFQIDDTPVDAAIDEMAEQVDGWTFDLKGRLASGPDKGAPFHGTYCVQSRSGSLFLAR